MPRFYRVDEKILAIKKGTDMRDQDIDGLFAEARAQASHNSAALIERVLADALTHQPKPLRAPVRTPQIPKFWVSILDALGGKGGLAGLGTAAVVGVMLGFVQPGSLTALTDAFMVQSPLGDMDLIPGIDAILTEG